MNEEVDEDSRWEEHSVWSGRGRGRLAETGTDGRVERERKVARGQVREGGEKTMSCRPS